MPPKGSSMVDGNMGQQRRIGTVYDAVAGKLGANGFLTAEQVSSAMKPHGPQEVLMKKIHAPDDALSNPYDADEKLTPEQALPDSDLLKAVHTYTSDFYSMATLENGKYDFKSLDESALLAMGILLEEAALEELGETGDMVLVEPEGLENALPETKSTRFQIKGRVKSSLTAEDDSDVSIDDQQARKKRATRVTTSTT
jgi:hypothetical protein